MKFGQYELLEPIAVGGMAEVFKGRVVAAEGFEKFVAIKRILPDLAEDDRFVKMLLTEARIHSALSHRNIVQIHDLGISEDGQYFIVLEYVEGYDLRIISEQLTAEGEIIPEALSLHIASELAQGLHFAHELRGADGQALGLVHRDVTPSNVLISFAGEVKLSDFGLAKRRHDRSVVGSLKGNLSYMSPEQAMQVPLDRRTDIFSLGAVLFELLTGRRLREITNEVAGWSHVASGVIPSARAIRPDLPVPIERLLDRALAADPERRYPDAAAFGTAIREVLGQMNVAVGASDLGALLGLVNPPRRPRILMLERSRVIRLGHEAQALSEAFAAPVTPAPLAAPGMTPAAQQEVGRGAAQPPSAGSGAASSHPPEPGDAALATPPPTTPLPPLRPRGQTSQRPGSVSPSDRRSTGPQSPLTARGVQRPPAAGTPPLGTQRPPAGVTPALGTQRPPMAATPALGTQRPPMAVTPALGTQRPPMAVTPALGTQRPPMAVTPALGRRPPSAAVTPALGTRRPSAAVTPALGTRRSSAAVTPALGTRRSSAAVTPALGMGRPSAAPWETAAPSRGQHQTARVQLRSPKRWRGILVLTALVVAGGAAAVHYFVVPLDVLLAWRKPARLWIATEPDGASLRLDGVALAGSSPTAVSVKRDLVDHVIEATLAGYHPGRAIARFDKSLGLSLLLPLERDPAAAPPLPPSGASLPARPSASSSAPPAGR
jgi:eukaryotic-like serine/threonine-protein kinase